MAEIQTTGSGRAPKGPPRAKRLSTRIDFTPMVDLGFLLITFFMLTTTLAKPTLMALVMPHEESDHNEPIKASKVLTLLLGPKDQIYWYEGLDIADMDTVSYAPEGLRKVILDKMARVQAQWGLETYLDHRTRQPREGSYLNVLIKATPGARYQNLVDALDEMAIAHVRYYVLLEPNETERQAIAAN